jgi:hypothetical protein
MIKTVLQILITILFSIGVSVAGGSIKIGVISDTHATADVSTSHQIYCDSSTYWLSAGRITGYETYSIPQAVTNWNAAGIDIALFNGDLVNGGDTLEIMSAHTARLLSAMSGLVAPAYFSTGHWDIGSSISDARYQLFYGDTSINTAFATGGSAAMTWWPTAITDYTPVSYVVDTTIDSQTWRFIFINMAIIESGEISGFQCNGQWDNEGEPTNITQGDWFDMVLDDADTKDYPCVVVTHYRFKNAMPAIESNGCAICTTQSAYGDITQAMTDMAEQAIPPIVLQGHAHVADGRLIVDNVTYFDLQGDLWSPTTVLVDDTTRYSHSILTLSYPAYTQSGKKYVAAKLTGFGNQSSYNYQNMLRAYYRFEDVDGASGTGCVADALGAFPLTSAGGPIDIDDGGIFNSDNIYYLNRHLDSDGIFYLNGTPPVTALPITVSFWYNNDHAGATPQSQLFEMADATSTYFIKIKEYSSRVYANWKLSSATAGTVASVRLPSATGNTSWWHVVVIFDTSQTKMYLNGTYEIQSNPAYESDLYNVFTQFRLLNKIAGTGSYYTGLLDEYQVYSGALTDTEIMDLYNQGEGKFNDLSKKRGLKRY